MPPPSKHDSSLSPRPLQDLLLVNPALLSRLPLQDLALVEPECNFLLGAVDGVAAVAHVAADVLIERDYKC